MVEIVCGIILVLVVLEVAWRVQKLIRTGHVVWIHPKEDPDKPSIFTSHPYCLYRKLPGVSGRYPSNRLGYAGIREYAVEKPANTVRVFVVGGSTAEDHDPEFGPDSSWPAQLEDILRERHPDVNIEVINAGLSGYSSAESLSDFIFRGLELKPDILLVYHSVNDALTIQMADGFRPDYSHVRQAKSWERPWIHSLPRIRFLMTYEYMRYQLIKTFGMPNTILERISTPPWKSTEPFDPERVRVFERNVKNLVHVADAWGCRPVVIQWECPWETEGVYPWRGYMQGDEAEIGKKYFSYLKANNEALRDLCARTPFASHVEVGPFDREKYMPDTLHFNMKGLTLMAERVADAIDGVVAEAKRSVKDGDR